MKAKLIVIIVVPLMFLSTSKATIYQPIFGKDSTYYTTLFGGNGYTYLKKDTVIDGQVYKILPFGNMVRITSDNSKAYLRPNSNTYNLYNQKEYLVMDLNMKLGDYFILNDSISSSQYNYQSISHDSLMVDSVYFKDGLKHIRFDRTMYHEFNWITAAYTFEFIEGVGTVIGFEYRPLYGVMHRNDCPIVCYFKDGTKIYKNEAFKQIVPNDRCFSSMVSINEKQIENPIKITLDNHATILTVKSDNPFEEDFILTLCSVDGRVVKRAQKLIFPSSINLLNLPSGIYIVTIKTATRVFNRKIVVNR